MTIFDGPDGDFFDNPLLPEESTDEDELIDDETAEEPDDGYSPPERPWGLYAYGTTADEGADHESLASRLSHEVPEPAEALLADPSDGEWADDQVGDQRAGRLVLEDVDELDARSDYWASDVGIDGGAASAEEAAMHVVANDRET